MPEALIFTHVTCPYCFSKSETTVDASAGSQVYYEDCQVCCAPMELSIHLNDDGELERIRVRRGND